MADQFQIGGNGQKVLEKFYKTAPRAFSRISAGVLTSMAFADRTQIPKTIGALMTVRTPSIIKKVIRVQKAKPNQPINQQQSISGSIEIPRHDAWKHIQEGKSTRITQFTDEGRRGSSQGVARKEAKAGKHTTPNDLGIKGTSPVKITQFLQALKRDKSRRRKPYYLPTKYKGIPRGVYKYKGGKVRKGMLINASIKRLSTPKVDVQPDRIDWKNIATRAAVNEIKLKRWWVDQQQRELNKIIKK